MLEMLSCREGVYGGWKTAIEYLPKIGVRGIELDDYPPDELMRAAAACRARGIDPMTIAGGVDTDSPDSVARVKDRCKAASDAGIRCYFLSGNGKDRPAAMRTLAALGDHAASFGVTLSLETHPPFCANAAEMLRTIAEIDHPNVRINFDTANVLRARQAAFAALERTDASTLTHYHLAGHDAYSVCLNRPDARTVSFSHITVAPQRSSISRSRKPHRSAAFARAWPVSW